MRRREFITLLGGAVAFPVAAQAQRTRRIGALLSFTENDAEGQVRIVAFRRQLRELGWSEGRNLQIDFRYVGGDVERMRPAAAELVALTPDVIFVHSNPGVAALQRVNAGIALHKDHVGRECYQFRRRRTHALGVAGDISEVDL